MTDDKYISAKKLKAHYAWWAGESDEMSEQKKAFDDIVDAQPAADVQEVKHGEWKCKSHKAEGMPGTWNKWYCSECKTWVKKGWSYTSDGMKPTMLYCSECGAIMDGKETRQNEL